MCTAAGVVAVGSFLALLVTAAYARRSLREGRRAFPPAVGAIVLALCVLASVIAAAFLFSGYCD
jgi:hypothetical protein